MTANAFKLTDRGTDFSLNDRASGTIKLLDRKPIVQGGSLRQKIIGDVNRLEMPMSPKQEAARKIGQNLNLPVAKK